MKRHPLADLALALVLAVQGVAVAAGPTPVVDPVAADDGAAMPCHGGESDSQPATAMECCGAQCLCDVLCGGAMLLPSFRAAAPVVPATPVSTPQSLRARAAFPDPRLRPPDSVLA